MTLNLNQHVVAAKNSRIDLKNMIEGFFRLKGMHINSADTRIAYAASKHALYETLKEIGLTEKYTEHNSSAFVYNEDSNKGMVKINEKKLTLQVLEGFDYDFYPAIVKSASYHNSDLWECADVVVRNSCSNYLKIKDLESFNQYINTRMERLAEDIWYNPKMGYLTIHSSYSAVIGGSPIKRETPVGRMSFK